MTEALLSAFLEVAFERLASRQVVDFFRQRKLDETLLNKLKVKLLSIDALADDAEQKQLTDPRVREWLFAVKDVVFDAEDLLADIDYELTKCQVEAESQSHTLTYRVSNFFNSTFNSFNWKIVSGMKEVLEKLEYLASQKGDLGLKKAIYSDVGSGSKVLQKLPPSTSSVVESVIYGRNYDKEIIFSWLTSETDNHNQLSILSVVGMGGLGKTTLAQHVYNDSRMEAAKFDIKAWVCVSDDFNVLTVTRTILEAITNSKDDSINLEMVHGRLKQKLSGKKFLLVLDDVWIQRQKECEAVLTPLYHGAPGSRILVTTRSESVASNMRSCKVHHLRHLQGDDCWQVFAEHAFQDGRSQLDSEINEIATKIVAKCKGLPLALTSIGCLLHTKSTVAEWRNVLLSNIWDLKEENSEIIPALFLSYCHLPSHLKKCFAFCALFPKDYLIYKKELILLWLAEGFLQCRQQSQSPLEVGEIYFDDLLSRSFFQQSSRREMCFNMHDLLNDLAKYVCGDICFRLGVDTAKSMPKTTRHLSFATRDPKYWDGCGNLTDAKSLRTFIPTTERSGDLFIPLKDLFHKFKHLRVLSFSGYSNLTEFPESVSKLKYLCLLDLSRTNIKRLPDSTCFLYNLQILKLNSCKSLVELPSNLYKLTNLCCLEFRATKVREMPVPLEKLKNLQVLSTFCVGKSNESSIKQLGGLNLQGELSIEELQNIVNPLDVLEVDLKNKTHLVKLAFVWNLNHIPNDPRKDREVLENLQPSKYVKDLSIENYGGTQFASWLLNNSLSKMVSLSLENCKYCLCLPSLVFLPSLKYLSIIGCNGIVSIGAEFCGSSSSPFPSLEVLKFYNMMEWEEWECTSAFPRLQSLCIEKCPKLRGLSEKLLHVKKLDISYCERVTISGPSLEALSLEMIDHASSNTYLQELRIWSCPNINIPMRLCFDLLEKLEINDSCDSLTTFQLDFFPKLCSLDFTCLNLQMISQERTHNHLKDMKIQNCPLLKSFPRDGLSAPKLKIFRIKGLENLKSLPKHMLILLPSLSNLIINDCPNVEMFSEGGLPSNLKSVFLSSYKLMTSLKETLGVNSCLKSLYIRKLDVVECFPEEGLLPLSLTSLRILECPKLKKLDYKGLCHLSSLKELWLYDCPKLECLPEDGLPKTISTLIIGYCPLLEQRCQEPEGEDWGKIAHIRKLDII